MDPIEPKLAALMNHLGSILDDALEECNDGKRMGFALFVFDFGKGGRMNYISNANRGDVVAALREAIASLEVRAHQAPTVPQ